MTNKLLRNIDLTSRAYHDYRGNVPLTEQFINGANNNGANLSLDALPGSLGGNQMGNQIKNKGLSNTGQLAVGAATSIGGQLAGTIIGDGYNSKVGSAISNIGGAVGGVVSMFNPVLGGVISGASGLLGGVYNRAFSSKLNKENIAKVKSNISDLNTFASNATDYDTLQNTWANAPTGMSFRNSYIGSNGWFNHDATDLANDLRNQVDNGEAWVDNVLVNNANYLNASQIQNLYANSAAYGGPLFALGGSLLTHGANFDTRLNVINNGGTHEENPYEGVPMGVDSEGVPNLVEEGEAIFNDYVFSKRLKVPKMIRNKYKLGGPISFADAAIKLSKESEERPNDPISKNGLDALLGELTQSQEYLRQKKQAREQPGTTFAKGGKMGRLFAWDGPDPNFLGGGYPIAFYPGGSNAIAFSNIYSNLYNFRYGDTLLYDPQLRKYNDIYSSDDFKNWSRTDPEAIKFHNTWWGNKDNAPNYYSKNKTAPTYNDIFVGSEGRYPLGYDFPYGNPNAFSDAHRYMQQLFGMYMNRSGKPRGKGERRWLIGQKDKAGTPLDPTLIEDWDPNKYQYVKKGTSFDKDTDYNDYYYKVKGPDGKVYFRDSAKDPWSAGESHGEANKRGVDWSLYGSPQEDEDGNKYYTKLGPGKEMPSFDNALRYLPIVGSLTGLGMSLFSKPDESSAEAILEASRGAGTYQPVKFNPIGNYLTYNPFDTELAANQANAESAAARRAILNTSGGNRAQAMAGILASNNNALNQLGTLRRGAAEDNRKQYQLVEESGKDTDKFNSDGFLKADMANQSALAQDRDFSLRGTMAAEEIRQRARLAKENAIQANLTGLFNTFGNISQERVARQQMKWMVDNGYIPGYGKAKYGGKIKRNKKGLTY